MNIGEYKIVNELSSDAIFSWFKAVDPSKESKVILQLLQPGFSSEAIKAIFYYFESLQTLRRKFILAPIQLFSSIDYPLIAIYPHINASKLSHILPQKPKDALPFWHQISETLHTLNNKKIIYGYLNIDSTIVIDSKSVYLNCFGYTPLFKFENKKALIALAKWQDNIAPEVYKKGELSPAADIYSFAKTIAYWHPQFIETNWYLKATDLNPNLRYKKIREAFTAFEDTINNSFIEEKQSNNNIDDKKTNYNSQTNSTDLDDNILISTRYLKVKVSPTEAGEVTGGNQILSKNSETTITANPSIGWYFVGWSGDHEGSNISATISMNTDKNIVASFAKSLTEDYSSERDKKQFKTFLPYKPAKQSFAVSDREIKVATLGAEGVDKTSYLLTMYSSLAYGINDFSVDAKDENIHNIFNQQWDKLINYKILPHRKNLNEILSFNFNYNNKKVLKFDYIDCASNVILNKSLNNLICKELLCNLKTSDCLFIFVSGEHFIEEIVEPSGKVNNYAKLNAAQKIQSQKINSIIESLKSEVKASPYNPFPVAIIITKYDLCMQRDIDSLVRDVKELFYVLFSDNYNLFSNKFNSEINDSSWLTTIIPVSIEKNFVTNNFNEYYQIIKSMNVHIPILFAVYTKLINIVNQIRQDYESISNELSKIKSRSIFSNIIEKKEIEKKEMIKKQLENQLNEIALLSTMIRESEEFSIYKGTVKLNL